MNTARYFKDQRFKHSISITIPAGRNFDSYVDAMTEWLIEDENMTGDWGFDTINDSPVIIAFTFSDLNAATMFKLKF